MSQIISDLDENHMRRALALAAKGQGHVEPNPMVGAVIVKDGAIPGEGHHQKFSGPHAEIEALSACKSDPSGATLYVTLEPCCHQGKTPPCTDAILRAGIKRVVVALEDPYPKVAGKGIEILRAAGVEVDIGCLAEEAKSLLAPYLKRVQTGKPWVIAKWAMTLDGKIAAADGSSKWITGETARAAVHALRGRVDAILIGSSTALKDDPSLTVRPPGPRTPTRVVVDRSGALPHSLKLFQSASEIPTLYVTSLTTAPTKQEELTRLGVEVLRLRGANSRDQIEELLINFGQRNWTNLLVEGGAQLLGAFFDAEAIDEVEVYIAPKLLGGAQAPSPIAGLGVASIAEALKLAHHQIEPLGEDFRLRARLKSP